MVALYGRPADEETPLRPVNVYAHSKVAGEQLIAEARDRGLRACVIRLSNVYGSTQDHPDRVVPAFARAALLGQPLRIDGCDHTFDFTHISDVVHGIAALVELLVRGIAPPPITLSPASRHQGVGACHYRRSLERFHGHDNHVL